MTSLKDTRRAGLGTTAGLLALILSGCAGTMHHQEGLRLLAEDKQDEGIAELREATRSEPDNKQFEIDLLNHQAASAEKLVRKADQARVEGDAARARDLYQRAVRLDPGNARAAAGLAALLSFEQHTRMLGEAAAMLKAGQLDLAQDVLLQETARIRGGP